MSANPLQTQCPTLTEPQIQALVAKAKAGHSGALKHLCQYLQDKITAHAQRQRWITPATPLEDIVQQGIIYVREMINKFDPSHGNTFWTYARNWVKKAVCEYLDTVRVGSQIPLSLDCPNENGYTFQVEDPPPREEKPEQQFHKVAFDRAMLALRAWEQELFGLYFLDGFNQTELGQLQTFGSRSTVQRKLKVIKAKFDHKLQQALHHLKYPPLPTWLKDNILKRYEASRLNTQPFDAAPQREKPNPEQDHRRDPHQPTGGKTMRLIQTAIPLHRRWHRLLLLFSIALAAVLLWHDLSLAQTGVRLPGNGASRDTSCRAGVLSGVGSLLQGGLTVFSSDIANDACASTKSAMAVIFFTTLGVGLYGAFQAWRNSDVSAFINPVLVVMGIWLVVALATKTLIG